MMKNLNISIISDVLPDDDFTGGQVLRKIINKLNHNIFYFSWLNQSDLLLCENLPLNCHLIFRKNFEKYKFLIYSSSPKKLPPFFKKFILIFKLLFFGFSLIKISFKLRSINKKNDLYWLVVQGQNLILIYFMLIIFNKKPFILQQWDPLSWWMNHRNYPKWFYFINKKLLSFLEKKAFLNIVPSDTWKAELCNENKKAVRLDNFIDIPGNAKLIQLKQPGVMNVVFIGQTYSIDELKKIVDTLANILNYKGVKLVLHYYGSDLSIQEKINCEVINHGYHSHKNLHLNISKYEIALLPYPTFSNDETARLSFPSKARIYIAAGLPILGFLPVFSGCHNFLKKNYKWQYLNIFTNNSTSTSTFVNKFLNLSYENKKLNYLKSMKIVNKFFSSKAEIDNLIPYLEIIKK
jgi:hypothetical protein